MGGLGYFCINSQASFYALLAISSWQIIGLPIGILLCVLMVYCGLKNIKLKIFYKREHVQECMNAIVTACMKLSMIYKMYVQQNQGKPKYYISYVGIKPISTYGLCYFCPL